MSRLSDVIDTLQRAYGMTVDEAQSVFDLGDRENQRLVVRGHHFRSGFLHHGESDEMYIDVYGPNGVVSSTLHCRE